MLLKPYVILLVQRQRPPTINAHHSRFLCPRDVPQSDSSRRYGRPKTPLSDMKDKQSLYHFEALKRWSTLVPRIARARAYICKLSSKKLKLVISINITHNLERQTPRRVSKRQKKTQVNGQGKKQRSASDPPPFLLSSSNVINKFISTTTMRCMVWLGLALTIPLVICSTYLFYTYRYLQ